MSVLAKFPNRPSENGFTLVELMITLAVLAILLVLAAPSFVQFRERQVVRGAADEIVSQVGNFRFEAVKRNRPVTISVSGAGADWCLGAELGASAAGCDCETEDACDVGRYPGTDQSLWRGARLVDAEDFEPFSFDQATGTILPLGSVRSLVVASPAPKYNYNIRVDVNSMGRASVCVPAGSASIAGVANCDG